MIRKLSELKASFPVQLNSIVGPTMIVGLSASSFNVRLNLNLLPFTILYGLKLYSYKQNATYNSMTGQILTLIFRGATKGGWRVLKHPSLKRVCPVIRPDPMTFLIGGYLHLHYYEHFRYFTTALTNSPVSDYISVPVFQNS